MPANVRSLDGKARVVEDAIPAADGAAVFVDAENHVTEVRVARAARGGHLYPLHADGIEYVLVYRGREVAVKDSLSDAVDEPGVRAEAGFEGFGEAAVRMLADKNGFRWVVLTAPL